MRELIWGINPVLELMQANPHKIKEIAILKTRISQRLDTIIKEAKRLKIPLYQDSDLPSGLPKGAVHQGVVAWIEKFKYAHLEDIQEVWQRKKEPPFVVILDEINDPQNLGSLIRSAEAAGAHGLIIPKHRSARITGLVYKVSAGAVEYLKIAMVVNLVKTLEFLKKLGLWIIGTSPEAKISLYETDLTIPLAIVIGSEGRGLRPLVRKRSDILVRIPMYGRISSLNASVAGAIVFFEILRQRSKIS